MTAPSGWNARTALASAQPRPWRGSAWRMHVRSYGAADHGGSLRVSARYHRAADQFPQDQVWPALYLALSPEGAMGEIFRQLSPDLLSRINDYRLSELDVELDAVLDCRDAAALGLSADDLIRDQDFVTTQEIAAEAIARGVEAILVLSATQLGDNLIVFPDQLRTTSRLVEIGGRDPRLYIRGQPPIVGGPPAPC